MDLACNSLVCLLLLERVWRLGQGGFLVTEVCLDLGDGSCVCCPMHQMVLLFPVEAILAACDDAKVVLSWVKIGLHLLPLATLKLGVWAADLLEGVNVGVANLGFALLIILAHFLEKLSILILEGLNPLSLQDILDRVNQRLALAVALRLHIVASFFPCSHRAH